MIFRFFLLLVVSVAGCTAALKFTDCGDASHAAEITSVTCDPYPVNPKEGFEFTVGVRGTIKRDVSNSDFKLSLWRQTLGFWIPIPCLFGYGSCTYDNGCQLIEALLEDKAIPDECEGISAQSLHLDRRLVVPEIPSVLGWLVSGTYKAKGEFSDSQGKALCLELEGELGS